MKKYIFMAAAVAAMAFTSCEDALDSNNYTKADTSNFPAATTDMDKELSAAYSVMNQFCNDPLQTPFLVYNLMSDDCNGGGGTGDVECHAVGHLMSNKPTLFDAAWKATYVGISRTNTIIYSVDNMDWTGQESARNQLLGEAYFLRGLYYLWGTQFWGDIPAYWGTSVPDPCPQQSAEDVIYPHILADFVSAANLMNQKTQGDGHATKYAAEAMLARAYMFYQGFYKKAGELATANLAAVELPEQEGVSGALTKDQVVAGLKDVIDNGGYKLIGDYRNLWQYTNEYTVNDYAFTSTDGKAKNGIDGKPLAWAGNGNDEEIFQVQFGNMATWNGSIGMGYTNMSSLYCGLRCDEDNDGNKNGGIETFPFGQGWGQGTVNANLWDDWSDSDPRKTASVLDAQKELEKFAFTTSCTEDAGLYNKKLIPVTTKQSNFGDTGTGPYTWWGVAREAAGKTNTNGSSFQGDHFADIVLVRLADVYLMHAELTGDATYLNKVRQRVGLPDESYSWQNIKNERRFELAMEGLRFNDLRRWSGKDGGESCEAAVALQRQDGTRVNYTGTWTTMHHASSSWAKRYAETDGFLAIPLTQIELVGDEAVLKQNKGWGSTVSDANMSGTPVY